MKYLLILYEDVAFFWQTHMLRPIQFEQDVARRIYGDLPVKYYQDQPPTLKGIAVPLKQIVNTSFYTV